MIVVGLGEFIRSDVLVKIAGSTGEVKPLSELESVIARKKEELGVCSGTHSNSRRLNTRLPVKL